MIDFTDPKSIKEALDLGTGLASLVTAFSKIEFPNSKTKLKPEKNWVQMYCTDFFNKVCFQKTFLSPREPINILSQCVDSQVSFDKKIVELDEKCFELLPSVFCIEGTAGQGKSVAAKRLALKTMLTGYGLPIFIELRMLESNGLTLAQAISNTFGPPFEGIDSSTVLEHVAIHHQFVIFLDGFDEVPLHRRQSLVNDLGKLIRKHENLQIIITSRPDETIQALGWIPVVRLNPLDSTKSKQLIQLCPCHDEAKQGILLSFDKLFTEYTDFFKVPLLLTVFILAYAKNPDVPSEPHEFFRQAFSALFSEHDAFKALFKRERYVKLGFLEYQRAPGAFCIITLFQQKFSFPKDQLSALLEEALEAAMVETNLEDLVDDMEKCTCIVQKDGLNYSFTHRSFQDYLGATFFEHLPSQSKFDFVERISSSDSLVNFGLHYIGLDKADSWHSLVKPTLEKLDLDMTEWPSSALEINEIQLRIISAVEYVIVGDELKLGSNRIQNLQAYYAFVALCKWFSVEHRARGKKFEGLIRSLSESDSFASEITEDNEFLIELRDICDADSEIVASEFHYMSRPQLATLHQALSKRQSLVAASMAATSRLLLGAKSNSRFTRR